MYIRSIRVRNYRSIFDSGALQFSPGFNLIVGANNVGKSSLLACLGAKVQGEPHRSLRTLPKPVDPLDQYTRIDFVIVASGTETRRALLECDGNRLIPWPVDVQFIDEHRELVLQRIFEANEIPFHGYWEAMLNQHGWKIDEYPSMRLYQPLVSQDARMLRVNVIPSRAHISIIDRAGGSSPVDDVGFTILQLLARRIYRFDAERLSLGHGDYGTATELTSNASNLPEVLSNLQGNPSAFGEFCGLVREVFPEIKTISIRTSKTHQQRADVLVWQIDPKSKRDDLAMPLIKCGTGVGQILAILYVAMTSSEPRTIIVDEPGSFLHPGASRALIRILRRFEQHQYIVATHSPEILSELARAPVTIVRYEDSQSVFQQAESATGPVATSALTEVGAKLSDVFGFDQIIWVEGQSDALSINALLEAAELSKRGLAVLPVRDTGAFKRRTLAEILDIYRSLSMGAALLPPAILFLFDRDGRTLTEMEDATRQSKGKVQFLGRRMFENYLLDPNCVATLFNEVGAEHGLQISRADMQEWFVQRGAQFCRPAQPVLSDQWSENVDGATLLESAFNELSSGKLPYKKTAHGPRLTVLAYRDETAAVRKLVNVLQSVVSSLA